MVVAVLVQHFLPIYVELKCMFMQFIDIHNILMLFYVTAPAPVKCFSQYES